jgi:hypothetical protein
MDRSNGKVHFYDKLRRMGGFKNRGKLKNKRIFKIEGEFKIGAHIYTSTKPSVHACTNTHSHTHRHTERESRVLY